MKQDIRETPKKIDTTYVLAIALSVVIFIFVLSFPVANQTKPQISFSDSSSISTICELATLRNYYHNVVLYEKEPDGFDKVFNDVLAWPWGIYTRVGYKQYWIEYSGIVEMGVNASQIQICDPDTNGIVKVYMPDAKILSVYADETTMSDPLNETGWFTSITGQEKTTAFSAAQSAMHQEAEND